MLVRQLRWPLLLPALLVGFVLTAGAAFAGAAAHPVASTAATPQLTYLSTDVPKAIPNSGAVTSTLTIASGPTITSIDVVSLSITHTFPADLNVVLISPHGTHVTLFSAICGGDDWTAANTNFRLSDGAVAAMGDTCPPGTGSYKPASPLAALAGESATGTWNLVITDTTDEDNGGLLSWGLAIPGAVPQATPTPSVLPTLVPQPTRTPCGATFSDVPPGAYFTEGVIYLACKGAISGYSDGTFRPSANVTRGQLAKIVVLGLDVPQLGDPATPSFTDVPRGHPFFSYIETAKRYGLVSGYSDGTFRPGNEVTRGQLAKMVVTAAGWNLLNPNTPTFTDVPHGNAFYPYIETAACYGILSGYADHTFRWGNSATRGQIAKIAFLADAGATPCAAVPTPLANQ
jgi:subtilisin-like proprotein convertase family protein